jgi:Rieske 2Fe-2S family protein
MATEENHGSRAGMRALAREYYTSPVTFAQELQAIFANRWLFTVHQSALPQPGSHVLYELASESIIIVRGADGEIRAFHNVCRHRGARLRSCGGELPSGNIRCPYHAWTYGLDGRLLGARCMGEVPEFDRAENSLIAVATVVWEGFVFINLGPAPAPFERAFAPMLTAVTPWQIPRLVLAERVTYDVAANWKLLFQNDAECYHCPIAHPRLNQLTPAELDIDPAFHDIWSGEILGGPMRIERPGGSLTESGDLCGPALVSGPERTHVHYYMLFPNMFLSLLPDYVLVHRLDPLGIDRTRVTCEWLFDPGYREVEASDPRQAVAFWDRVNREDWHVCELVQQGLRSRAFVPGLYSEQERMTAAFDRAYLEALGRSEPDPR